MNRRILAIGSALALALSVAQPASAAPTQQTNKDVKGFPIFDRATGKLSNKVLTADGNTVSALAGPYFHYTEMHQGIGTGANTSGADGVAVLASQHNPYVQTGTGGSQHSLWEVAISSGDNLQHVEVGIRKTSTTGSVPSLFVFSWTNNAGQGYDSANPWWVDNPSEAVNAGTALAYTAAGAQPTAYYQYRIERQTNLFWSPFTAAPGWRIIQKNQGAADRVIGYFTDTQWTSVGVNDFQKVGILQTYGEAVSTVDPNTCTDLAGGVYGTSANPSAAGDQLAYSLANAPVGETNVPDGVGVIPTSSSPNAYRVYQVPTDLDRVRWGGPGFAGPTTDNVSTAAGSVGAC